MSTSIWTVGNRIIRFVNLLHNSESSSKEEEDSQAILNKGGMNHRNDENRGRKQKEKVDHVVATRSRTRGSFSSPNASVKSASNTPSPAINGFHGEESPADKSFAIPTISPRKLKELRELNESSTWKDPSVGKHPRLTRRSLTSQRTSPRMPALKVAPQSSTPNIFPIRPSTRSQVKQNGCDTNGVLDSPQPSTSALSLLNGVQKRRISLRHEHPQEPVAKKQRVNKLKLKIPSRISKIKKRPIKIVKKFKPYKTKKVLVFDTSDIEDSETFETIESLRQQCMKKRIPVKKSKAKNSSLKMKVKKPPKASDSAFAVVPETLENVKVDDSKVMKSILPIIAFTEKKLLRISLSERTYIKRSLRLKRPSDANFLLPFPRNRLHHNPKFKIATKKVKLPPLKNGIKWLALLTPCQRSCNCMKFQTKRVKWDFDFPNEEDVKTLKIDEICSCCRHSLWVHRRKYDVEERRKRYTVLRDIIIVQKMLTIETNKENLRVLFILLKDLMSIITENQALPKECFPYKNSLIHELSIRRHVQAYMQTKEARKLGFLNRHAQDLLQTLEEFIFPPPDQIEKYSYTFKFKKYSGTVVEKTFLTWYRHFYLRWLIFCRLPYFLNSLPKFETCNIMSFQFVELFAEEISLKLEEKYEETEDSGVKAAAVMFRRLRIFARNVVTISKRSVKRMTMKGYGSNVLEDDYEFLALPQSPDAMETRNTPALDNILQEESGPFTYIQHFEDDSQPLEVTCPLPFAKYFWKLAKHKKYKLFLDSMNGPKNELPLTLRHDPNTLTDLKNISHDIQKTTRVSRWRSNCDKERAAGKIEMLVLRNIKSTTCPKQNDFLMQFISVIHRQLPKMPKHYIIRLVMDGKHRSMILLKYLNRGSSPGWAVLGGICFRPFKTQSFSEIVFVAVHADHQVRGYGGYLMDQLKRYHVEHLGFPHLLTFADKNAIGYFKKQGFSRDIGLPKENYHRYIKEYEGATLMYCQSRLCNTPEDELYWAYKLKKHLRNLYFELCPEWKKTYDGLEKKFLEWDLLPMKVDRFEQVDNYGYGLFYADIGLPQLFWKRQYELIELNGGPFEEEEFLSEDEYYGREDPAEKDSDEEGGYTLDDELATPDWKDPDADYDPEDENSTQMMFMLVEAIYRCPYSWPFHYPVDEYDAPTYSEDLNQAMTLEIIEDRLDWGYYIHERMLFLDFARIFINCYAFNEQQDGPYYHACYRLHQYFNAISLQIFGERVAPYLLPIAKASSFRKPNQKADQVVFDPLRPYWYPIRVMLPPPPPAPKSKKTSKKKLTKTRSRTTGSSKKQRKKSQTPAREKTPTRKLSVNSSSKKVQTKLVFNQNSSAGYHLEILDDTTPERRTTRAAARTTSTTPNTPSNSARRRKR